MDDNYLKNSSLGEVRWTDMFELVMTVYELLCISGTCVVLNSVAVLYNVVFTSVKANS